MLRTYTYYLINVYLYIYYYNKIQYLLFIYMCESIMSEASFIQIRAQRPSNFSPEDFHKIILFNNGLKVVFRSLTPADIPKWENFIRKCSNDSLYSRFQGIITGINDQGSEFCKTDYTNVISITAEIDHKGQKELIAVARLMRDKNSNQAEYAILVRDDWQNKGIGNILTSYCENVARKIGIKALIALTTLSNYRMIRILQRNGFFINYRDIAPFIEFRKMLS